MASTIRQAAKAATRAKVLAAARVLFESDGYELATIRSIAFIAGMSTGAVFANFADKADLYAALYGHPPISPEAGAVLLDLVDRAAVCIAMSPRQDTADEQAVADRLLADLRAAIARATSTPTAQTEAA